jgi:histidine ammonia-lyase
MGAALKTAQLIELAEHVVAIELLAAAQAIDLLAPLATSPPLDRVRQAIRARVPRLDVDRPPSPDIAAIVALIRAGDIERAAEAHLQ